VIRQCRDIPGKELFQYYTENKERKKLDSGMVNQYIRETTGSDFTAKDFRTWAGTLKALESFQSMKKPSSPDEIKQNINCMLDEVSKKLGNTRNICKKYYIHSGLITLYEENKFFECLDQRNSQQITSSGLNANEKRLMHILKKCRRSTT
jgi:DNA topoisomerase-1